MRNLLLLLLTVFILNLTTNAQAPQLLNYQGVARNGFGNALPNRKMTLRLSILNGSNNGAVVYSETRIITTNAGGLYTVLIGSGGTITSSGTIASINWQTDAKFLRVEVDPDAGSNFIDLGTTQLVSVPYAMSANIATPVGNAGGDLTGNYPNPGIANGAITTTKLADLAVTTLKLSDQSITTTKLADGSVTTGKLSEGSVTTSKLADANVTTAKLADASITDPKIVTVSGTKVTGNIAGNAANVTGTIAIVNGGTGATTVATAKTNLGLNNVDNTSDLNKPISTATQTALDLKENLSNKSSATNLGTSDDFYPTQKAVKTYVDGQILSNATPDATASIKGKIQLAGDLTGNAGAPEVAAAAITTNKIADAAVTTAKVADASVTDAKIVGVSGSKVTGDIVGNAANVTGTVAIANGGTGATTATAARSNLGLGNVDNTSDLNKPISTATQAALDLKENISNKSSATNLGTSDDLYPTQKAVKTYVDGQVSAGSTPDATANVKGKIKLAGDLTGDASAPEVAAAAITTTKIADAAVTTAKINDASITTAKLTDGNVTTAKLADASVTDVKIAGVSGSKVSGNIAGNASNVTGTVAIANGGTGATTATAARSNLGLGNVDNTSDLNKPISTTTQAALDLKENLSNKSTAATLGTSDDLYPTQKAVKTYVDGQVSAGSTPDATANVKGKIKLAGDLTGDASAPEVAAAAITTTKIADAAVTTAKINDASVTTSKLADAAITTVKVVDANITTAKLADASVTDVKIVGVSGSKVAGNITGNATNVTGTVAITNGGTGATTVAAAKTNLGLNNVDNTSDLNKPISTATQSALDLKAPINNPTFTGTFIASGITYPGSYGTNGQVLTTDGNGTTSWSTPTTAVTTVGAIGASSDANGATISGSTLTLTPADATNGGIITNGTQTFAGDKTFSKNLTINGLSAGKGKNSYERNTALGESVLSSLNSSLGTDNTGIGFEALKLNENGSGNTSIGSNSLAANTTGSENVAVGYNSLLKSTASFNTAIGVYALGYTTSGIMNTASGRAAIISNTTGNYNSGFGAHSMRFNTSGSNNSAFGSLALDNNSSGSYNTGVGYSALATNTSGTHNTAIGNLADVASNNLTNATAIGNGAKVSASNSIQLGNSNVTNVKTSGTITAGAVTYPKTDGTANQVLSTNGSGTLSWVTPTTAVTTVGAIDATSSANGATISGSTITLTPADATNGGIVTNGTQTFAGDKTFSKDLTVNGLTIGMGKNSTSNSTALGSEALKSNTTGYFNTATGASALKANTTGINNTALGGSALRSNTAGGYNTASGSWALNQNLTGSNNTAVGNESLFWNTTGSYNTATGSSALNYNETGIKNTANGSFAITSNTSGNYNSALGYSSLLNSTTGSYNTAIGKDALSTNTTGNHNTAIGNKADVGSNNLENATAIGDSAIVTSSNTIQLGNTNVTNVKTSGTITAGAVTYPKTDGTANQVLTTNGSGMASWQTPSSPQYAQILLQSTSDPSILTLGGISIRIQNNYLEMRRETNNDPYDFQIFASSFQNTTSNYNSGAFTTTKFGTSLVQTSLPGDWYKLIADETELVGNYYYKFEADLTTYNSFKSYKVKVLVNGNGQVVLRMEYYP